MAKQERLTVGCRARILTLKELPRQRGEGYCTNEHSWRRDYGGREVLLTERSNSRFCVILLGKGVKTLKEETTGIVANRMAWLPESDLVLVDRNFDDNLNFIDWYSEHQNDFCPDCLAWHPDQDKACPNKKCPSTEC